MTNLRNKLEVAFFCVDKRITFALYFKLLTKKKRKMSADFDKISYALGMNMGNSFRSSGIKELDVNEFSQAIDDVMKGASLKMSYDEAKQVMSDFFAKLQEERLIINKKAGEEFLKINKERPGVKTTDSGIQYEVLQEGTGAKPKATDSVKVHYEGKLIDGQIFDSSIKRGEPASFGLNQVIPGWTEALQLMPVGSKYRIYIPSHLAYGERGAGEMIEPNSTLVFDVELLDIV
ncbi:FKBP-type peptidyl-prolyl cis-trans isomerase FklB [Dysgonomonadaceae bacterium PH5-43]|nr:FKBP-type peptidyl-prolyl cis-trans isomerase FklB [Dysgonomonadaceae bacterium PH5-43]